MRRFYRCVHILLVLGLLLSSGLGLAAPQQQDVDYEELARQLLEKMTPEERVGQLFLVTFEGVEAGPRSEMHELIVKYHVGGVILRTDNDNFLGYDQTVSFTQDLTRQLQNHEYSLSLQEQVNPQTGETYRPTYVPLLIGVSQEGNGYPYDQILNPAMTQLPSQMAIGSTWQPELARQVGNVLGSELSALGINLLLGPSLDVLENPHSEGAGDLGIRTFGGDPYWVGEMGRAFISGVHQGSSGEMAVIAKHFPGYGSSDRLPEEEVATVLKSLEQLMLVEIPPFLAVTGNAPNPESAADGLLTAHIRYPQEGNIRKTTKPLSLDPSFLSEILKLAPLQTWRQNGGVMVSDDLGSQAIRRFYDYAGQSFSGRTIAHDAFRAGNDLLYLGNFSTPESPSSHAGIVRTIEYFNQRYQDDTLFAQRVDESVIRILALKYRLYQGSFGISKVLPPQEVPAFVGNSRNISLEVLRQAATLIWPSQSELNNTLPNPPGRNENIIFITDVRYYRQCSRCPLQAVVDEKSLEEVVVRMYASGAGGQVLPRNLTSYTFVDLTEMLDSGPGIVQIENDLKAARWVVFLMLNEHPGIPSSTALSRFLNQRIDLLQGKNIIVFSLSAPNFLDSTDISKLTAYYALYSKIPSALDIAARLLFQDLRAPGFLPVSVPSARYDLNAAVQPSPNQVITLYLEDADETGTNGSTPTPGVITGYKIGDLLSIVTGVIVDANGHRVPDDTPVRFIVTRGEGGVVATVPIEAKTVSGIARAIVRIDGTGQIQIRAESERARNSNILTFDIPLPQVENGTPTVTPAPTSTPTPTHTQTPTPTLTPTATPEPPPPLPPPQVKFGDWFLVLFVVSGIGLGTYWVGMAAGQFRWGLRAGFLALIGGLLAYAYLALQLPGTFDLLEASGTWGVVLFTAGGAVIGNLAGWSWKGLWGLRRT
jgi:beta-N-acetylhexosaminidase